MVWINKRQRELNNDLGAYLERRRPADYSSSGFFKRVDSIIPRSKAKSPRSEAVPDVDDINSTVYERPTRSWFWFLFSSPRRKSSDELSEEAEEELEHVEEEIEEVDEEAHEIEDRRESLLTRFFNILRGGRREEYEEDIPEEVVRQTINPGGDELSAETREVLKLIHKWISRLSPEQIAAFKRSPDFKRYKDLLDQYGLIK